MLLIDPTEVANLLRVIRESGATRVSLRVGEDELLAEFPSEPSIASPSPSEKPAVDGPPSFERPRFKTS